MNRTEKLAFLYETCSSEHVKPCTLLEELVQWMGEADFAEFYEHHCSLWDIKTPEELDENR